MNFYGYIKQLEETIVQLTIERDLATERAQEIEKKYLELKKPLTYIRNGFGSSGTHVSCIQAWNLQTTWVSKRYGSM